MSSTSFSRMLEEDTDEQRPPAAVVELDRTIDLTIDETLDLAPDDPLVEPAVAAG
ncbi:MAG: hypothetical protein R3E85_07215 [Planctomycetota bacterium]